MSTGHAQLINSMRASHSTHAHSHQVGPARSMRLSTTSTAGMPIAAASNRLFNRSTTNSRGVSRLNPKRASSLKVRHSANGNPRAPVRPSSVKMTAVPSHGSRPAGPAPQRIDGVETSADGQSQQHCRIEYRFDTAETHGRDRVVRRLGVLGGGNLCVERLRHACAMRCDCRDLPSRQPQLQRRPADDGEDEDDGQPGHAGSPVVSLRSASASADPCPGPRSHESGR